MRLPPPAPHRAPSPERLHPAPPAEVTCSELPFSCSLCHGSPVSTWCRTPRNRDTRRPRVRPSPSPSASETDRPQLTAPARPVAGHHGTRGPAEEGNYHPVNVGLQHPTAPLAESSISASRLQIPECSAAPDS